MSTLVTNTYKRFTDHSDIVTPELCSNVTENSPSISAELEKVGPDKVLRGENGKLLPGVVLNPNGRPKSSKIVSDAIKQALAEGKAEDVKDKLFGLMDEADRDSVRLAAISEIMDRSEGKAVQNVRHAGVFMVLAPGEDVLAAAFGGSAPDESE